MSDGEQRVVIVTGGTRGIGRACVEHFARAGDAIAFCGRNEESVAAAQKEIAESTGGAVQGLAVDIGDPEAVNEMVASVTDSLGPPQVLVNNAGLTRDGLLMRMKDADWDSVMKTNLDGAFYCCRAVVRGMIKQRYGRIVNLSSIVGLHGQGGQTNYAAAKAGIIGLTKSIAQEVASRNITANVVAPGYIETDMTAEFSEKAVEELTKRTPAGRPGTAEEVASAVAFLASDDARYITGHVLSVDGGLGM